MCSTLYDKFCLIYKGSIFSSWARKKRPSLADKKAPQRRGFSSISILLFIQKNNHCYCYYLSICFYNDILRGPSWDWDLLVPSTAKTHGDFIQFISWRARRMARGVSNWLRAGGGGSGRSRTSPQPRSLQLGCLSDRGMGILCQILRIQALTRTPSHVLSPNFNSCICAAEQGQPEARLAVRRAAHPYYLLKHLQAGSRATLLILPGTKAQEYPMFSSMFKGTRVMVPARRILMGSNTTAEARGLGLSSCAVVTFKSKPEQMEGGEGGGFGHNGKKKSVCTRMWRLW